MFNNSEIRNPLSNILQKCYEDAFAELPSYNFIPPQRVSTLFPVTMPGKACHCLSCDQTVEVEYTSGSAVYADKDCLDAQRTLYKKYDLGFPDIEKGEPLVYLQEGYCTECSNKLADSSDTGQLVYNLSTQLVAASMQLIPSLLPVIKNSIKANDREAVFQAAEENAEAQKILKDYAAFSLSLVQKIASLLDTIEYGTFTAYTGRPLTMVDSMSATLFNEYTVAVPVKTTPAYWFYIKSTIKKEKVRQFLSTPRITTVNEVLAEPGVMEILLK